MNSNETECCKEGVKYDTAVRKVFAKNNSQIRCFSITIVQNRKMSGKEVSPLFS